MKIAPLIIVVMCFATTFGQRPKDRQIKITPPQRIRISSNGLVTLNNYEAGTLNDFSQVTGKLAMLFAGKKGELVRKVVVEPDESICYRELLNLLHAVREARASALDLVIDKETNPLTVSIPVLVDSDADITTLRPNPLTLMVSVSKDEHFFLNGDSCSSWDALLERLKDVFHARVKGKAFRKGTSEIEATVFLEADPSLPFVRVVELLRRLHKAGAKPLNLKIDDLQRLQQLSSNQNVNNRTVTTVPPEIINLYRMSYQLDPLRFSARLECWRVGPPAIPTCRDTDRTRSVSSRIPNCSISRLVRFLIRDYLGSVEFRPITPEDYELVRQFLVEVGWRHRVGDSETFRRMIEKTDRTVVAWDGSQVVGFARALCDGVSNGYISLVAVAAERRGEGMGRKLVETLMGDDPNITWVLRAGRGSDGFWKKIGFKGSEVAMERIRASTQTR